MWRLVIMKGTMKSFVLQMLKKQSIITKIKCKIFLWGNKGKLSQKSKINQHLNANNRVSICKPVCQDKLQLWWILLLSSLVTLIMIAMLTTLPSLNMPHHHFFKDWFRHQNGKGNHLSMVASVSPNNMKVRAVIYKTILKYWPRLRMNHLNFLKCRTIWSVHLLLLMWPISYIQRVILKMSTEGRIDKNLRSLGLLRLFWLNSRCNKLILKVLCARTSSRCALVAITKMLILLILRAAWRCRQQPYNSKKLNCQMRCCQRNHLRYLSPLTIRQTNKNLIRPWIIGKNSIAGLVPNLKQCSCIKNLNCHLLLSLLKGLQFRQ